MGAAIERGKYALAAERVQCRLPVPWDHPRCQKHGTTSRPQPPAEVMISTPGRIVKCAVGAVSAEAQGVALPDRFSCRRRVAA
jgi:hypothetical protein